jgi:hypothetical protein
MVERTAAKETPFFLYAQCKINEANLFKKAAGLIGLKTLTCGPNEELGSIGTVLKGFVGIRVEMNSFEDNSTFWTAVRSLRRPKKYDNSPITLNP